MLGLGHYNNSTDKGLLRLLTLIIKAVLNSQQNVRDLTAATFDVHQYKVDSDLGKALTETGNTYAARVREATKEEAAAMGPPHVHPMNTLLEWAEKEEIGAQNRLQLQEVTKTYKDSWEDVAVHARFVKTAKCDDDQYRKIFISMQSPLRDALNKSLKQTDLRYLQGRAPKGGMERELESWLSEMMTTSE